MKIELWLDSFQWRWRLVAPNGRAMCVSADSYDTKPGVRRSVANFVKYLADPVPVEEVLRSGRAVDVPAPKIMVRRPRAAQRKAS